MTTFHIDIEEGPLMRVGFGEPAQNDEIVRDAVDRLEELSESGTLEGGGLLRVNGPASMPVAFAISHAVAHLYEEVAIYDPKLDKYVVAISHGGEHEVGALID